MTSRIHRVTLFKLPDPDAQDKLLAAYQVLATTQAKDGKPYISYLSAGRAFEDDRAKGYTIVAKTEFASLDDMRFYDQQCPAHAVLKQTAGTLGLVEPPLSAYYEGAPIVGN